MGRNPRGGNALRCRPAHISSPGRDEPRFVMPVRVRHAGAADEVYRGEMDAVGVMVNVMDPNNPGSTLNPVCVDFGPVLRDFNLEVQVIEVTSRDRVDAVLAQPCSGPGEA